MTITNETCTPFLHGTILRKGAKGKTVRILQQRLESLRRLGKLKTRINYIEYKTCRFGNSTATAVTEYIKTQRPDFAGSDGVNADIWQSLGLPIGETWQDMFAIQAARNRGATISVELKQNAVTIIWRPRFVIYNYDPEGKKRKLTPDSTDFYEAIRSALAGALRWNSNMPPNPNPIYIHGVNGSVHVEVYDVAGRIYDPYEDLASYDFAASGYFDSNVAICIGKPYKAIVWDAFRWRRDKKLRVKISVEKHNHFDNCALSRTMEHEFGHVLGLFDAYGYADKQDPIDGGLHYGGHPWPDGLLPPAPIDGVNLKRNSVMVCNYSALDGMEKPSCRFERTSLDYEMMLFAWRDNKLQLYTDGILGKKSQAFYYSNY